MKRQILPILVLAIFYACSCSKSNKHKTEEQLIMEGTWHFRQIDSIGYDTINSLPFHHAKVILPTDCERQELIQFSSNHVLNEWYGCDRSNLINGATWILTNENGINFLYASGGGARGFYPTVYLSDTIKKITPDSLVLSVIPVSFPYGIPIPGPSQPWVLITYTH